MRKKILTTWKKNKRYIILGIVVAISIFFSIGVYFFMSFYTGNSPFSKGELFYENKEYDRAKEEYFIYLESSKYGLERWNAWNRLYYIVSHVESNIDESLSILGRMEKEFEGTTKKERIILDKYISLYTKKRDNKALMESLEKILLPPVVNILTNNEKIQFYKEYSRVATSASEFKRGINFINSTLPHKDTMLQIQCLYELGTLYMGKDDYKRAREYFNDVLKHVKKEDILGYMSIFLLANMAVSKGELVTAKELFEEIVNIYPNKEVIKLRLAMIEKMRVKLQ